VLGRDQEEGSLGWPVIPTGDDHAVRRQVAAQLGGGLPVARRGDPNDLDLFPLAHIQTGVDVPRDVPGGGGEHDRPLLMANHSFLP
jgi:hypothetical protein